MKTIVIAGGKGFLGKILENYFSTKDYTILILTRQPTKKHHIYWDGVTQGPWIKYLNNTYALINLAGKSVDCRYTTSNKKKILDSRVNSTIALGKAISSCKQPPKYWFNSSTATIYIHAETISMTEATGIYGDDFSMNVAKKWESAFHTIETPLTKKVVLRTGIVLGKTGGAFPPLKRLTKIGLGGKQGSGRQKVSWIHELDFAKSIEFICDKNLEGIFNIVSPTPTNNLTLMRILRQVIKIPFGLPQPKWMLELGASLINTETELILKSRNVYPKRLLDYGFNHSYKSIEKTIFSLVN